MFNTVDTAPDAGSSNFYGINSLHSDIVPSASTVNQNPQLFNPTVNIDPTNTGFDINSVSITNGYNTFQGSGVIGNFVFQQQFLDFTGAGTITDLNFCQYNSQMHPGAKVTDFTGYEGGIQVNSSATISDGLTMFSDGSQIASGGSVNFYSSANFSPELSGTVSQYTGVNVSASTGGTIGQYTGINVSPDGPGTVPNLTGISVNLSNVSSINQKIGLNIDDGALNINSNVDTSVLPLSGEFQNSAIGGNFHIASGHPVSGTFGFGNNLGISILAEDNMAADNSLGSSSLGFNVNGFVNTIEVAAGKTVDTISYMAAGGGIGTGSTGGTITNFNFFRTLGLLPEGGTLAVTNLKGFAVDALFGAQSTTNSWAFHDASGSNNYFSRIALGTVTQKVSNSDIALEIGGLKTVRFANVTTTQKNAITGLAGMQVFDTTLGQMSYYNGTAWVNF